MGKIDVILTSNIVGLGAESDQVTVAAGYARNYLFPRGLAIPLTMANKKRIEALKARRAEREAQELNSMKDLAKSLEQLICIIKVKTGEDGKMFGNVTNGTIADNLKNQFDISIDKKKILLDKPIKALGDYEVEIHLHPEVKTKLKVRVESLNPLPEAVLAAMAAQQQAQKAQEEAAAEQPKTEKRKGKKVKGAKEKAETAEKQEQAAEAKAEKEEKPKKQKAQQAKTEKA